jgi:hydrogenase maturation factor
MCLSSIGTVVALRDESGAPVAEVEMKDRTARASTLYVPEVKVGDDVLVHLDFIVEVLDPRHATEARTLVAEVTGR